MFRQALRGLCTTLHLSTNRRRQLHYIPCWCDEWYIQVNKTGFELFFKNDFTAVENKNKLLVTKRQKESRVIAESLPKNPRNLKYQYILNNHRQHFF